MIKFQERKIDAAEFFKFLSLSPSVFIHDTIQFDSNCLNEQHTLHGKNFTFIDIIACHRINRLYMKLVPWSHMLAENVREFCLYVLEIPQNGFYGALVVRLSYVNLFTSILIVWCRVRIRLTIASANEISQNVTTTLTSSYAYKTYMLLLLDAELLQIVSAFDTRFFYLSYCFARVNHCARFHTLDFFGGVSVQSCHDVFFLHIRCDQINRSTSNFAFCR